MSQKKENPAAVATASGASDAVHAEGPAGTNNSSPGERPHPQKSRAVIKSLTLIPDAPAFVMVQLVGCEPIKVRIAKLRSAKRFRASVKYRLGLELESVSQDLWAASIEQILEAAMGGAA